MKKGIVLLIVLSLCLMLFACNTQKEQPDTNIENNSSATTENSRNENFDPPKEKRISVRSIEELEEMKQMLEIKDETLFAQYLHTIEYSGEVNREDLVAFVNMADEIPYVKLVDGEISWINYSAGVSRDTGKEYEIFYISTKKSENEWCRIEYYLNIENMTELVSKEDTLLSSSIKSKDERLEVFTENIMSENTLSWMVEMDDFVARIVYKTNDTSSIKTQEIYKDSVVSRVLNSTD